MTRTIPLLLLALGLVAPRTAAAQSRDACSGEQTNLAIRKCLNREAARADTTLARSVDSLARSMDDSGAVRLRRVEELGCGTGTPSVVPWQAPTTVAAWHRWRNSSAWLCYRSTESDSWQTRTRGTLEATRSAPACTARDNCAPTPTMTHSLHRSVRPAGMPLPHPGPDRAGRRGQPLRLRRQ